MSSRSTRARPSRCRLSSQAAHDAVVRVVELDLEVRGVGPRPAVAALVLRRRPGAQDAADLGRDHEFGSGLFPQEAPEAALG